MARLTQFVYSPCGNSEGMRIPSIFELSDWSLKALNRVVDILFHEENQKFSFAPCIRKN
ncbi:hypothetical protein [Shewanella morhuae]|uniref:hypothetical protein n=1 Tax=Shewanella morhuae TaxID=365591 RepID=UPI001356378E|nr:hypothetical protein [Shewanella morhuae]